jgi:putative peptide maturation dehydrogenase
MSLAQQHLHTSQDVAIHRLKRSVYACFYLVSGQILDPGAALQGQITLSHTNAIMAVSPLTCQTTLLNLNDLKLLFQIPSDNWVDMTELAASGFESTHDAIMMFARAGLVLIDTQPQRAAFELLKQREETLRCEQWHPYSALYHHMSKWSAVSVCSEAAVADLTNLRTFGGKALQSFTEAYGDPPAAFYECVTKKAEIDLPLLTCDTGVFRVLSKRYTTRAFRREQPLSQRAFALLLYYVYGCHGYAPLTNTCVAVKRTSPSGGGLHPIEVYPLVRNVDGIDPGLYHYNLQNHSLELIESLSDDLASELANQFTAGQVYPKDAHALLIMTARFYRNHWKYRKNSRTYGVILMDAGHLSQTLYLVATDLGLGAFVTAAINGIDIEARLGIDGYRESAIAICGVGIPGNVDFKPEFRPYVPRATLWPSQRRADDH